MSTSGVLGTLAVAVALWQLAPAHLQSVSLGSIRKGELVERMTCADKPDQSYALYIPSNYRAEKRWPILYALDPGAHGKIPVEHFKDAAEKYGWIIAGSNNSRNGPIQQSVDAVNAIWNDTHQRFTIDERRIYFAGFSGGARAATTIATACRECVAGIIAGGAGFPAGLVPSLAMHFNFFGTIGIEDFNFPELRNLDEALTRAGLVHQIETFEGRHEWAPAVVTMDAVEWMELKAMAGGNRARDEKFIDELWQKKNQQARTLEGSKQFYDAYQMYLGIANAFRSIHDLTEIEKRIVALAASREVKDALRLEGQQIKKQRELEGQIYRLLSGRTGTATLFTDDNRSGGGSDSTDLQRTTRTPAEVNNQSSSADDDPNAFSAKNKLQAKFADLQKAAKSSQDSGDRRVARRVIGGIYVGLFEQGLDLLETQKRYVAAARVFELTTELAPERPGAFYYLASAYALNHEKKKAVQALKEAIDKGFSDSDAVKNNKAFESLRNEPSYEQIIQRLANAH